MELLNTIKKQKYSLLNLILVCIAFFITVLAIGTGSFVHENENLSVGMVSPRRYVAPRDFEDTAATEKLKEEARASVGPLYKHDDAVQEKTIDDINALFDTVNAALTQAEQEGAEYSDIGKNITLQIPVALNSKQFKEYGALSSTGKSEFRQDIINITEYIYEQGVTQESKDASLEIANDKLSDTPWNDTLKNAAYQIISSAIQPNLVLDEEAMNAAIEKKLAEVEPVMIIKNQKIVDEGELITSDILNRLEALGLVNQEYSQNFIAVFGCIVIVALLFGAMFFYFKAQHRRIMVQPNQMTVLFICYVIAILILKVTDDFKQFYFIPLYIFAMLVSMLISMKLAIILNTFVCIAGTFIFNGSIDFLIYFLLTGSFCAIMVQYTEKRKRILSVTLLIAAVNFISTVALGVFTSNEELTRLLINGGYAAVSGIFAILIVLGSMPFWEGMFEINTPFRLLDLANPNNELLRRLMLEAPGTYHHSLIVANLAEAAAYDINANTAMVRAGAYYHDIGKLGYPLYFSENQAGDNVHDSMQPSNSARIIIQHVTLGLELAQKYRLPKIIKDIIVQHHGTTLVKYFYYKAIKLNSKENVNEEDFRYPGPSPETKEAAIVMLADTVEAAVRSNISGGKNLDEIEELINVLVKDKLDDGQLNNCNITFSDITKIKKAFLRVFKGMYHDRIAYPKEALNTSEINKTEENK